MNQTCIFETFNKKKAVANPFIKTSSTPGKYIFPNTGTGLAQAVQYNLGKPTETLKFNIGGNGSTPQFNFAPLFTPTSQPLSTIPEVTNPKQIQTSQSLFQKNQSPSPFDKLNNESQKIDIRLTKYTSDISIEKVIAVLSSEAYTLNEDLSVVSQLNPCINSADITKVAPLTIVSFVEDNVSMPMLSKLHLDLLRILVVEKVTTEEDVWNFVYNKSVIYNLQTIIKYINVVKSINLLTQPEEYEITPEVAFVLALHAFITNNDRPYLAVKVYSNKQVRKLTVDMCMASYGLTWVLDTQTQDYVRKHRNTYILSC
jgi:hypothetical protein